MKMMVKLCFPIIKVFMLLCHALGFEGMVYILHIAKIIHIHHIFTYLYSNYDNHIFIII